MNAAATSPVYALIENTALRSRATRYYVAHCADEYTRGNGRAMFDAALADLAPSADAFKIGGGMLAFDCVIDGDASIVFLPNW